MTQYDDDTDTIQAPPGMEAVADAVRGSGGAGRGGGSGGGGSGPGFGGNSDQDPEARHRLNLRCALMDMTDLGNARRLQARFGADLIYQREVGWRFWTGRVWESEGAAEYVRQRAHDVGMLILAEVEALQKEGGGPHGLTYAEIEVDGVQAFLTVEAYKARVEALFGWHKSSCSSAKISAMLTEFAAYASVPADAFDRDHFVLNLVNGTLELDGACERLRPHARADRQAKMLEVVFDPGATCPRWEAFLGRVQPQGEVRAFLQRWSGYCLTGSIREQKLVFHHGAGANGKSVFLNVRGRVMGAYAGALAFASLRDGESKGGDRATPDLARLPGVRMVRVGESDRAAKLAEGMVKTMTGGDPMLVRNLNQGFFEFTPVMKLELQGNHKPVIQGQDEGIWRRIVLVPWEVIIPPEERDQGLAEALWAERSGILNWMLDGLRLYLESGLQVPDSVLGATAEFRTDSDPLGRFVEDCVFKTNDPRDMVPGKQMYEAFVEWCEAAGERVWSQTAFGRALAERRLVTKERSGGSVRYVGCSLVPIDAGYGAAPGPDAGAG